ncbi:hypothetical protein Dimus_039219 [Dionaea muscipula]
MAAVLWWPRVVAGRCSTAGSVVAGQGSRCLRVSVASETVLRGQRVCGRFGGCCSVVVWCLSMVVVVAGGSGGLGRLGMQPVGVRSGCWWLYGSWWLLAVVWWLGGV